jgi:cytoskeletal protein CcmA (bactofilin family)
MFSKKNDSKSVGSTASKPDLPPPPQAPKSVSKTPSGVPSIISSDLKIVGNIFCDGDMQIDGLIEGDIETNSLTVGETANVKGVVRADTVRISGKVSGEVQADKVILTKTAHVEGDVIHRDLAIENGAFLEGAVRRVDSSSMPGASKSKKTAAPKND